MNLNILDNKIDLDFDSGDELLSAILLSVFTDAKADDEEFEEVKEWELTNRGYWGDQLEESRLGSKLWLLKRRIRDEETLEKAVVYTKESLQWMLDDELVSSVEVQSEWENEDLLLQIKIDGQQFNLKYEL